MDWSLMTQKFMCTAMKVTFQLMQVLLDVYWMVIGISLLQHALVIKYHHPLKHCLHTQFVYCNKIKINRLWI